MLCSHSNKQKEKTVWLETTASILFHLEEALKQGVLDESLKYGVLDGVTFRYPIPLQRLSYPSSNNIKEGAVLSPPPLVLSLCQISIVNHSDKTSDWFRIEATPRWGRNLLPPCSLLHQTTTLIQGRGLRFRVSRSHPFNSFRYNIKLRSRFATPANMLFQQKQKTFFKKKMLR